MTLGLVVSFVAASVASQEDVLTPTDVLESGKASFTARFSYTRGTGKFKNSTNGTDLDAELETFQILLEAGVGLGHGFELELEIPYQIRGTTEAEGMLPPFGPSRLEFEEEQFGDLTVRGIYRLFKEDASHPQWIIGAIGIAPVGWGREADPELTFFLGTVDGETGGIGERAWKGGIMSAISKRFGVVEPYFAGSYVFAGDTEIRDKTIERRDFGVAMAGLEIHVSPQATFDLRGSLTFNDEEVTRENNTTDTEEKHVVVTLQAQVYMRLGSGVTLVVGGGATGIEDHLQSREDNTEIEDFGAYFLQFGFHVVLR